MPDVQLQSFSHPTHDHLDGEEKKKDREEEGSQSNPAFLTLEQAQHLSSRFIKRMGIEHGRMSNLSLVGASSRPRNREEEKHGEEEEAAELQEMLSEQQENERHDDLILGEIKKAQGLLSYKALCRRQSSQAEYTQHPKLAPTAKSNSKRTQQQILDRSTLIADVHL